MGHKIHPTAFRLAVNQTWLTLTHPTGVGSQRDARGQVHSFIFPLIHNSFLAINILTSFPVIKIIPGAVQIHVKVHPGPSLGQKVAYGDRAPDNQRISYLTVFLKSLIQKKLNMRVQLSVTAIESYNTDPKIMGDWLAMTIGSRPLRLKGIVKGALSGPSNRS